MENQDRNMPAQQENRDDLDDERMRGTEEVRGIADDESDEDFDESDESDESDEEDEGNEGSF